MSSSSLPPSSSQSQSTEQRPPWFHYLSVGGFPPPAVPHHPSDPQQSAVTSHIDRNYPFRKRAVQANHSLVRSPPSSPAALRVHSFDGSIIRTLSTSPIRSMPDPIVGPTITETRNAPATAGIAIPRRNLHDAFEELYVEKPGIAASSSTLSTGTSSSSSQRQHHHHQQHTHHLQNHQHPHQHRSNQPPHLQGQHLPPSQSKSTPDIKSEEQKNMVSPTGVAELSLPDSSQMTPKRVGTSTSASNSADAGVSSSSNGAVTGVPNNSADNDAAVLHFDLHRDLKGDLSQDLVNRVSFYGIIHDINKEATAMAANDDSKFNKGPEEAQEKHDALVVAVNGKPKAEEESEQPNSNLSDIALVDEEKWLLSAINSVNQKQSLAPPVCPPTFPQAMGEREYENPLNSLSNGSRTQLWKPSRSWWEAKSGKNPWIEPKSHNKRWRFLWPLIHYHKFLARCIKKLKRNGVDVKNAVSPVAVFLREDVCAVSDHLASVSLFDSEKWMDCLAKFEGWTTFDKERTDRIRSIIGSLSLRQMQEPGDVDSPLLRSQIDAQVLRVIAASRQQMNAGESAQSDRTSNHHNSSNNSIASSSSNHHQHQHLYRHNSRKSKDSKKSGAPNNAKLSASSTEARQGGLPPMHPNNASSSVAGVHNPMHARPNRWPYQQPHQQQQQQNHQHQPHNMYWAHGGWNPAPQPYPASYTDDTSVHSGLSGDTTLSQHHGYDMNGAMMHPHTMAHVAHPPQAQYYPHMMYAHPQVHSGHSVASYDAGMVADPRMYHAQSTGEQYGADGAAGAWMNVPVANPHMFYPPQVHDPNMYGVHIPHSPMHMHGVHGTHMSPGGFVTNMDGMAAAGGNFSSPSKTVVGQAVPPSPYWGHLDPLNGIVSPQSKGEPATPQRVVHPSNPNTPENDDSADADNVESATTAPSTDKEGEQKEDQTAAAAVVADATAAAMMHAQPLLLRAPYYGYGYGGGAVEYGPPSPATQFLMSPQTNATYNYNYGYGVSPRRPVQHMTPTRRNRGGSSGGDGMAGEHTVATPPAAPKQATVYTPQPAGENEEDGKQLAPSSEAATAQTIEEACTKSEEETS